MTSQKKIFLKSLRNSNKKFQSSFMDDPFEQMKYLFLRNLYNEGSKNVYDLEL